MAFPYLETHHRLQYGPGVLRCDGVCRHLHSLKPSLNFNYIMEEPDTSCFQNVLSECLTRLKAFRKNYDILLLIQCYYAESGTATQSCSEGWKAQLDQQNHV